VDHYHYLALTGTVPLIEVRLGEGLLREAGAARELAALLT
jgi:hypothetical protein